MANIWTEQSTTKHHSGSDRAGGFSQSIPLSITDHLSIEVLQQNHTVPSRNHYQDPAPAALRPDSDQIRHYSNWRGVVWQYFRLTVWEQQLFQKDFLDPQEVCTQCYMRHRATKSLTTSLTSWFDRRFKRLATTEWRRVAFLSKIASVATFRCRATAFLCLNPCFAPNTVKATILCREPSNTGGLVSLTFKKNTI